MPVISKSRLRTSLRQLPEYRSLPARKLDQVLQKMVLKEYRAGQMLWRTEKRLNFWAVIDEGAITLEHRSYGVVTYTTTLSSGDRVNPSRWKPRPNHISAAWALTDVRVFILRLDPPATPRRPALLMSCISSSLWALLVLAVILSLGFQDIRRILSDTLLLAARQPLTHAPGSNEMGRMLGYANALDPGSSFAYNQQGVMRFQDADLQGAADLFDAAVQGDPGSGTALNNLAVTYFTRGDVPQAVQLQQGAILSDPDNARVRYNLGIMLVSLGRQAEALRAFKEAAIIQPAWVLPEQQQALLYLQMEEYSQAEASAARATRLDPSQPAMHLALAIALHKQGRHTEALAAVDYALALSPEQVVPGFYKALILESQGKREEALALLHRLLQSAGGLQEKDRIAAEIRFLESQPQTLSASQ